MRIAFFSSKSYEQLSFDAANAAFGHEITYLEPRLSTATVSLAAGFPSVCVFVNDQLDAGALQVLSHGGTRLLALRSAGFNHVDLAAAGRLGLTVVRVPAYSPHAVAEHTVGLILALNRRLHRAYVRVREGNFSLDGLMGFDLDNRTVGVVGTGKIGEVVCRILQGFGCHLLAFDPQPNPACQDMGVRYVGLESLLREADIVTLHCPLTDETRHLIDARALQTMKDGAMLINTSRGGLVDTPAVVLALKSGKLGELGLDVYEEEAGLFFEDHSDRVIQDDVFARLLTFPNVLVTGHQAFFTREAVAAIARTTLSNVADFERGGPCPNTVRLPEATPAP
jgi:D-lactate dehydrogenase